MMVSPTLTMPTIGNSLKVTIYRGTPVYASKEALAETVEQAKQAARHFHTLRRKGLSASQASERMIGKVMPELRVLSDFRAIMAVSSH
jgi:hypothetical protein